MDHYHHSPKHLPNYDSFAAPAYLLHDDPLPTTRRVKYNSQDLDPKLKAMKDRYDWLIDELDSIEKSINDYQGAGPSYAHY